MEALVKTAESLLAQNIFLAFLLAYIGGLLTTFTPCVYPLIPVTLAITLGTETTEKDRLQKLVNPFFYCLGIAVIYSLLGVFAAATGTLFGRWTAYPWLYLALAIIFILLGLNSLGVINLPTIQFQYKADRANKISLFLLGAFTGVVFSPCTAPMMGIFLAYAATQSLLVGGLLLFSYAAGFSTLLLILAGLSLFAKDKIPRSGVWLEKIKWFIVLLCFIMAAYLIYKAITLF